MKKEIDIIELFAGIGGFSKGFQDAGYTIGKHYFSEIDKHSIANFKHNFPHAESLGTVTDISGDGLKADIITFGSPCQDFSLAGKRAGMDGQRSNLITEAIRLIDKVRPGLFIWENVKGAFSSNNGSDFWGIIAAFTNLRGYRLEWQLVNTSWFLPQNRERIYLVGYSTTPRRDFKGIFPIGNCDSGANERTTKSTTIRTLTAGGKSGGLHSSMTLIKQLNHTNDFGEKSTKQQNRVYSPSGIMACLSSSRTESKVNILNRSHGFFKGSSSSEIVPTLNIKSFRDNVSVHYLEGDIRRLTEIECERLQGFPDNWTKFGVYEHKDKIITKEIPKTARYKMLGNAVTVIVVLKIIEKIKIENLI